MCCDAPLLLPRPEPNNYSYFRRFFDRLGQICHHQLLSLIGARAKGEPSLQHRDLALGALITGTTATLRRAITGPRPNRDALALEAWVFESRDEKLPD